MPLYVLNLKLKDKQTLQVDTGRLAFNLFYFDKRCKGRLYVYCDDGEYSWNDGRFRTFSRPLGRNAPIVFRRIMRKQPKYLLFCPDLEGMNTILYVINNEVFIYRIVEMEKYKLDDYMKNRTAIRNSWWPTTSLFLISGHIERLVEREQIDIIHPPGNSSVRRFFISAFSLDIPILHYFKIWNIEERFSAYQMSITPQEQTFWYGFTLESK